MGGFVYIMASKKNGALYTGMTNDLARRVFEHKEGKIKGFTAKYKVKTLVYYEYYDNIEDAIAREKCIKEWQRDWKLQAIEGMNFYWRDLYEDIAQG